jgi:hypothetical protein
MKHFLTNHFKSKEALRRAAAGDKGVPVAEAFDVVRREMNGQ